MKTNENKELYAEQVKQLYTTGTVGLLASLLNAPIVVFVLWNFIAHQILLIWFSCLFIITLLRYALIYQYQRAAIPSAQSSRWSALFIAGALLSGLGWGSASIFLFSEDFIACQVFLAFVLSGMVAGATTIYAASRGTLFAYIFSVLIPLVIRFLLSGEDIQIGMGALTTSFTVLMTAYALKNHNTMLLSLKLRFENSNLIKHLEEAKRQADIINEKLVAEIKEREKSEQELTIHRNNLSELVRERTAEVEASRKRLIESEQDLRLAHQQLQVQYQQLKASQETVRKANLFLENMLQSAFDGIIVTNEKGNIIRSNRAFEKMIDCSKEELNGKHMSEIVPLDQPYIDIMANMMSLLREKGFVENCEVFFLRKDGSHFPVEFNVTQVRDETGKISGAFSSIRDITERKKIEQQIKESRDFLENIFKTSADGILIVGKHNIITTANDAAEKILGYPKKELIGKALTYFDVPGDIHDKRAFEFISRLFDEGTIKCFERQYVHKDGHLVDVELSAALRKDAEGNVIDAVAILRDITDRKQVEKERKKLEEQLRRSEKMETVGLLAGGVAHDLNNMLGAIVGYPELLLDDLPGDSPLRPAIKAIKDSGERAAAIVQDLLTLTRRGVTVNEIVNLNALVRQYGESRECAKLKEFHPDVNLQQNLDPALLNLIGSPVHLLKVIANLVSNAAEAITGAGTIQITTENRHLDKPVKGYDQIIEGDYVVLCVEDNGIGIAEADLQRIFEPFYTKKVMGRSGTGLGMSVVWGTVKDHGGYIDLVSRQGQGTAITLYFPATRSELQEQAVPFSLENYMGSGQTILVVDDVELQRDIARAILTKLRYRVATVASGEEAVEYLKKNIADLLVLDMIMDPGMDGLDTYRKILELHPGQKAVIASGYSETDRVKQAQALGAGAYIKKPYTIEKLGLAIQNELANR